MNYVVSGFIRSGTSMMMRMLHIGGLPVVYDAEARPADEHNPGGYYESHAFMELPEFGLAHIDLLDGKAVKVLAGAMPRWPADVPAKVIFMDRDPWERQRSMALMRHASLGLEGPAVPAIDSPALTDDFISSRRAAVFAMPQLDILAVDYAAVRGNPRAISDQVNAHLGLDLDTAAMASVWSDDLYRNRAVS